MNTGDRSNFAPCRPSNMPFWGPEVVPARWKVANLVRTLFHEIKTALTGKSSEFAMFRVALIKPSDQLFGRGYQLHSIEYKVECVNSTSALAEFSACCIQYWIFGTNHLLELWECNSLGTRIFNIICITRLNGLTLFLQCWRRTNWNLHCGTSSTGKTAKISGANWHLWNHSHDAYISQKSRASARMFDFL